MKKAIFVVRVDNYLPNVCAISVPTIRAYAKRIGADYIEIKERKWSEFPPTYEKMQIYELGKGYDKLALIDADYMIHPKAPDILEGIDMNYVGCMAAFDVRDSFNTLDTVFEDDGRFIGISSNFVVSTSKTHELWKPLEITWEQARKEIIRDWNVDEYCLSINLSKNKFMWTGLYFVDEVHKWFVHIGTGTDPMNINSGFIRALQIKKGFEL